MTCPSCGHQNESGSKFCEICGTKIEKPVSSSESSKTIAVVANSESNTNSGVGTSNQQAKDSIKKIDTVIRIEGIIGLIIGTIIVLMGFNLLSDISGYMSDITFGADFYTYSYNGIRRVFEELQTVEKILSWVVISIGALIDVYSLINLRRN